MKVAALTLCAVLVGTMGYARAQQAPDATDIGKQRVVELLTGTLDPKVFSASLRGKLSSANLEQALSVAKVFYGELQSVAAGPAPSDPRLLDWHRYVATFTAATVDVYIHWAGEQLDGLFMTPPSFIPLADQNSKYIAPPAGWTRVTVSEGLSKLGVAEFFIAPNSSLSFRQNINVVVTPAGSDSLNAAIDQFLKKLSLKLENVEKTPMRCGRFTGSEITGDQVLGNGIVSKYRQIIVVANHQLYAVTYSHLEAQEELPGAVSAVQSLCGNDLFAGSALL